MNKPTVVWDWDGTLAETIPDQIVSRYLRKMQRKEENIISLPIDREGNPGHFLLYLRPGVDEILSLLAVHYQLVLWTFSVQKYIQICLRLTKLGSYFPPERLITRTDMENWGARYKDLYLLNERFYAPLDQTVIIDDGNAVFGVLNPYNCIDIPTWTHTEREDKYLMDVPRLIEQRLVLLAARGEANLAKDREARITSQ